MRLCSLERVAAPPSAARRDAQKARGWAQSLHVCARDQCHTVRAVTRFGGQRPREATLCATPDHITPQAWLWLHLGQVRQRRPHLAGPVPKPVRSVQAVDEHPVVGQCVVGPEERRHLDVLDAPGRRGEKEKEPRYGVGPIVGVTVVQQRGGDQRRRLPRDGLGAPSAG